MGFIVIPEKLILDVFDRSWRGPWDRFGIILDAFWGPVGVPRAPWRGFGCSLEGLGAFGEVFFWSLKGLGRFWTSPGFS